MAREARRLEEKDRVFIVNAVRHRLIETHLKAIEDPRDALSVAQEVLGSLQAYIGELNTRIANLS